MASAAVSRALVSDKGPSAGPTSLHWVVFALFFISGIPALVYQIAWQRSLFLIYGVNIESVTIVVSMFMLGLGLGSIAGGWLSKRNVPLLAAFAVVEGATGVYGLCSLKIFHYAALTTAAAPLFKTGCLVFVLLIVPTALMGSTLPLLLTYVVRQLPNVGRATGLLYFVNTLGSACACILTGMFLMRLYGLSGSVRIAGCLNLFISACVLAEYVRTRGRAQDCAAKESEFRASESASRLPLSLSAGMMLAGASGFIALAYEIIWCRVFSFATATDPKVFAYLLAAYLLGIAIGSLVAEHICKQIDSHKDGVFGVGMAFFGANLWALFVAPEFANLYADMPHRYGMYVGFAFVTFAAALLSLNFPLLSHLTITPDHSAGSKLSYLYFSNIIGASLGSLVVGYVMFEYLSLRTLSLILAGIGLTLGIAVMAWAGDTFRRLAGFVIIAVMALGVASVRFDGFYNLFLGLDWAEVLENRHEVITTTSGGAIFGGGGYDGAFNTDPIKNNNWIIRLYAALTLHPAPKNVLMVGLSSGSWAQVIVNDPRVEHLTVVEINPGYLKLIPKHPEVASLLQGPKMNLIIDDGRRWMISHPNERYDFIVMNTAIHWRANSTNLLSQEFLQILKPHLNPGGVYFFNSTASPEAEITACDAFPYIVRISNFIAGSDSPLHLDKQKLIQSLLDFRIDSKPIIPDPSLKEVRQEFSIISGDVDRADKGGKVGIFEYGPSLRASLKNARIVTDDNMAVEWHRNISMY